MNRLPDELLSGVFSFLHQEDKVECMTVCRHWEEIITTSCLFHTVRVSSEDGLARVLEKIKNEPSQAAKVERLMVDIAVDYEDGGANLDDLLLLLPNLRVFFNLDCSTDLRFFDEPGYPFHKTIEHISEFSSENMVQSVLRYNICPNLTTLDYSQNEHDHKKIYLLLKNAPNLRTLNVHFGVMNLTTFETIHENAPSLTSLSVYMITVEDAKINHDITPASLITKLIITRLKRIDTVTTTGLLPYIDKKYPNLKHFTYDVSMAPRPGTNDCLDTLLRTIKPSLKSLSITSYGQPETKCRFLEDDAWLNNQPELKLTRSPSSLLDQAVFSNAIQAIKSLTLLNVTDDKFHGLKNFTSLRELKLVFSKTGKNIKHKKKIKFQDVLDSCPPSLKSLSLELIEIEIDFHDTNQYLIESLSFDRADLPLNVDSFISQHFPKLSTLRLSGPEYNGREFVLPNTDLYRFQFGKTNLTCKDTVLVSTLNNNEKRYYTLMNREIFFRAYPSEVDDFDDPIYLRVKSSLECSTGTELCFTLVCHSVINVEINQRYINTYE